MKNLVGAEMAPQAIINSVSETDKEGEHLFGLIHESFRAHDLETFMDRPTRVRETFRAESVTGLIDYVNAFQTDATRIFGTFKGEMGCPVIEAVIDHHEEEASHCTHRALYVMEESRELRQWRAFADGTHWNQKYFAEFITEHLSDVITPASSDLLQITRQLQATKTTDFQSGVQLENGARQFKIMEDVRIVGEMEVPAMITLFIPLYDGLPEVAIDLFLRWKLDNGIYFSLTFKELSKSLDREAKRARKLVETDTGLKVFEGNI